MPLYHEGTAGINVLFFAPKYVCKSKYAFLCGILDIINCADNMALYFVNKFCCMCVGNINLSIIDLILRAIGDLSKMGYVCIYVYIYTYVYTCEQFSMGFYIRANFSVCICMYVYINKDYSRFVGFLRLWVSFAEYRLFYRGLLHKRLTILKSLLIEGMLIKITHYEPLECLKSQIMCTYICVCVCTCIYMCAFVYMYMCTNKFVHCRLWDGYDQQDP